MLKSVIVLVGACLLVSVAGIIVLAATDHSIPDVLQNISVGSLTGLVGLLARPSTTEVANEQPNP